MIHAEALARASGIGIEQAERRVGRYEQTFLSMKPWLPPGLVRDFLDIGCGISGIAVFVAQHYGGRAVAHLLDGNGAGEKWGGFRKDGRPWNDVGQAARIFRALYPGAVCADWGPEPECRLIPPCELVYSICAWGHHFPIEMYVDMVHRVLRPGGRLIVDLRREHAERGREELHQDFDWVADIPSEGKKYIRTVWGART